MSIPKFNIATKTQNECEDSIYAKPEKSADDVDMVLAETETVTTGPVNVAKSKELVSDNIDHSKDFPAELAVWAQFGPTHRPVPTPAYPLGPESVVVPETQIQPKTALGYPWSSSAGGANNQAHAYPQSKPAQPAAKGSKGGGGRPAAKGGRAGGKGGGRRRPPPPQEEDSDETEEEGSEEGWEYTPETKNRWVAKIMALACLAYLVTVVAVLVMDDVTGPFFEGLSLQGVITTAVCFILLLIITVFQSILKAFLEPPSSFIVLFVCIPCTSLIFAWITVYLETYVGILSLVAMVFLCAILMVLGCTKLNFNSWCMYALVPCLGLALLAMFIGLVKTFLEVEYRTFELIIVYICYTASLFGFVFVLQKVLSGDYKEYDDEIYIYAATALYTAFIVVFLIVVLANATRRRRRRGIFF